MTNKEIIEKLKAGQHFNIKGVNTTERNDEGIYIAVPKIFETYEYCVDCYSINPVKETPYRNMNVDKFGPTVMWLYAFDMLGNQINRKVRYSDITFID